jgi:hypothetical protein
MANKGVDRLPEGARNVVERSALNKVRRDRVEERQKINS